MNILGPPSASKEQVIKNLEQFNPAPMFVNEMAPALWQEAIRYGVNPVVAIAQSGKETAWGRFKENNPTGVLDASFHNTCGLKTASGGGDYDPDAHERSATWNIGARKCIQHLLAYMGVMPHDKVIDPRFGLVYGKRQVRQVHELDAWATKPDYGRQLEDIVNRLSVGGPGVETGDLPLDEADFARITQIVHDVLVTVWREPEMHYTDVARAQQGAHQSGVGLMRSEEFADIIERAVANAMDAGGSD